MNARPRSRLAWALLGILVLPPSGAAQELGVSIGPATSDYRELASPVSTGVHASVPVIGWLHARADYRRYDEGGETWTRSTCQGLVPPDAFCPDDVFEGDFTLSALAAGLTVAAPLPGRLTAEAGVQRSWTWADGVWTGRESGATVGRAPYQREGGWSYLASISYRVSRWVRLSAEARIERPKIEDCIADGYSGFCDQHAVRSLGVGLSVRR